METTFQSEYSLVNNKTGEIVPINIRVLGTKRDFNFVKKAKFYKLMDTFTESIMMDKELNGKAIKLLFWILKQLDFSETTFILNAKYAAKKLEVTERTYYNWKKVLEKKEIIKKITGDLYMLNPSCVAYENIKETEKAENVLNNVKNAKILKGVKDAAESNSTD